MGGPLALKEGPFDTDRDFQRLSVLNWHWVTVFFHSSAWFYSPEFLQLLIKRNIFRRTWFWLKWRLLLTLTEPPRILQPRQDRIANGPFDFPFFTSNGIKASWRLVPIRIETFFLSTSGNSTWRKCDNCFSFMRDVACLSGIVRSRTAYALPTFTCSQYWLSTGAIWKSTFTPFSCLSLAHCGEKQLSLFPLNTKLLDEGWIDHGKVRARVDQTVNSRLSSIIADNLEGYNLQENLRGFSYSWSRACARGGTLLDTRQGCCNGWDVCDFGVVCLMISISWVGLGWWTRKFAFHQLTL